MKHNSIKTSQFFRASFTIFTLTALAAIGRSASAADVEHGLLSFPEFSRTRIFSPEPDKFNGSEAKLVTVTNVEELYAAINNSGNAGATIALAAGVYMLSVNNPRGNARPNGGRLELQGGMSVQGIVGDRSAVVIDAMDLPADSYSAPPVSLTAAIRMGVGVNSIEWLTARNAINGNANIGTDLPSTGTVYIRVMHVASTNSCRGLDVRNFGVAMAGRIIEAEIIDNDFYNNQTCTVGEGLRLVNNNGADAGRITAQLSGNRSHNNFLGLIIEDNGSSNANISVMSSDDQFSENGNGAFVGGGLSSGNAANGNTVSFTAIGSSFINNNGFNNFDHGGLVIIAGENTAFPNGTSDNTVNVSVSGCIFGLNQEVDLMAIGAWSNPESIGPPGMNNHVTFDRSPFTYNIVQVYINSIPDLKGLMNTVMVFNH